VEVVCEGGVQGVRAWLWVGWRVCVRVRVRVWVGRRVRNTERTFSSDSGVMSNVTGLCSLSIPSRGCPRQPAAPKRDAIYSESWQMWPNKMLSIAHVTGMGFVAQPVPSTVAPLRRIYRRVPMVVLHGLQHGVSCCTMLCCSTLYFVASCNILHCVCNMVRDTSDGSSRTRAPYCALAYGALASASLHVVC
jgi:hypothetical protein